MLYIANVHLPSDRCVVFIIDLFVFILAIFGKIKLRLLIFKKAHLVPGCKLIDSQRVQDYLLICKIIGIFTKITE